MSVESITAATTSIGASSVEVSVDEVSGGSGMSVESITAAATSIGASSVEGDQSSELSAFDGFDDPDMSLSAEMDLLRQLGDMPSPVQRQLGDMPSPVIASPDLSRILGDSPGILSSSSIVDDSSSPGPGSVDGSSTRAADGSQGGSSLSSGSTGRLLETDPDGNPVPQSYDDTDDMPGGGGAGQGTTDPVHMQWGKAAQRRDKLYKAAGGGGGGATQPAVSELTWEQAYPGRTRPTCPTCRGFTEGAPGFPVTCQCKSPNTETRAQKNARLDGTDEDAIRQVWQTGGIGEQYFTRKQKEMAARMRKEDERARKEDERAALNMCETCGNKVNMEAARQRGDGTNWEALGPCDCPLPPGWQQYTDDQGRRYYVKDGAATTWTRPFHEPSTGLHSRVSRLKF